MLYDGISISEGGNIANATIASGSAFPSNPNSGELFFRTDSPNDGLYVYDGTQWSVVGTGTVTFDALNVKQAVRAATTANITLSGTQTIDDVVLVAGDRVLVKNQTTASQNGIYVVAAGAWSRSTDFDGSPTNEVQAGDFCFVAEGTANGDTGWVLTTDGSITIGTSNLVFAQFTGANSVPGGASGLIQFNDSGNFGGVTGFSVNQTTGALTYYVGNKAAPGNLSLIAAGSSAGTAGEIQIIGGETQTGTGGIASLRGGTSFAAGGNGGLVSVAGGGANTGNGNGGSVSISGGVVNGTGTAGNVTLSGGVHNGSGVPGVIRLRTNNLQRFEVTGTGALSIGTTSTAYGTSGQVLTSNGNAAPSWQTIGTVASATNIAGGDVWQIPFQTAAGVTSFDLALRWENTNASQHLRLGSVSTGLVRIKVDNSLSLETRDGQYTFSAGPGVTATANDTSTTPADFHGADHTAGRRAGPATFRGGDTNGGSGTSTGGAVILRGGNNTDSSGAGDVTIAGGINSGTGTDGTIFLQTAGEDRLRILPSGNVNFIGTGVSRRIYADFSSSGATRAYLQSAVAAGFSNVGILPGAGGTGASVAVWGGDNPESASFAQLGHSSSLGYSYIDSGASTGGTVRPLLFRIAPSAGTTPAEVARITTSGAWSFGATGTATGTSGQVLTSSGSGSAPTWQTSVTLSGNNTFSGTNTFNNAVTVGTPTASSHATTKEYVDNVASGLNVHLAVRAATTANLTATYSNGTGGVGATLTGTGALPAIDGVTLVANDRVLVKNQSTQTQNGIYTVTTLSPNWVLTRTTDFDNSPASEVVAGDSTFVQEGSLASTQWVMTTAGSITIGTSNIVFTQFGGPGSYVAGDGLTLSGTTFSVGTASTSRIVVNADNIDLGTVGTAVTDSLLRITTDAYGRVTATSAPQASDVTTALGYTPVNRAIVVSDWNSVVNGQYTLISGFTNGHNGTTVISGAYFPHATGGFGMQLAGRLDNLYLRTQEADVWSTWKTVVHSGNFSTYASSYVLKTGDTMTGNLTLSSTSSAIYSIYNSTTPQYRGLLLRTNGSQRWFVGAVNNAETGSNAGSDFQIVRNDDSGVAIDTPLQITRSSGLVSSASSWYFSRPTPVLSLNSTSAGQTGQIDFRTANAMRWAIQKNNNAESGSDAGSNFAILRYNDAGTLVDTPFLINRASGNIGLGATGTTPQARIEVRRSEASAAYVVPTSTTLNNDTATVARFSYGADDAAISAGVGLGIALSATPTRGEAYIVHTHATTSKDSGDLSFWTTNAATAVERMRIDSIGNVGIGTSPGSSYTLDIFKSTNNLVRIASATTSSAALYLSGNGNTAGTSGAYFMQDASNNAYVVNEAAGLMVLGTSGAERMRITAAGSVQIGSSSGTEYGLLVYKNGAQDALRVRQDGSGNIQTWSKTGGDFAVIDNAGNLGVGTMTPTNFGAGYGTIAVNGSTAGVFESMAGGTSALRVFSTASEARMQGMLNTPMTFYTNNTERVRISSTGAVGIGTDQPLIRLTVVNTSAADGVLIRSTSFDTNLSGSANGLLLGANYNTGLSYIVAGGSTTTTSLVFSTANNAAPAERMRIDNNGNVGIGIAPVQRLSVFTAGVTPGYAQFTNGSTGAAAGNGLLVGVNAGGNAIINHQNASSLLISTFGSERMRINSDGNVGIGTSTPGGIRLAVDAGSGSHMASFNSTNSTGGYVSFVTSGTTVGDVGTGPQIITSGPSATWGLNARTGNALVLATSQTERVRVTSTGSVWVNTTVDAGGLMHVSGTNSAGTLGSGEQVLVLRNSNATAGSRGAGIRFDLGTYTSGAAQIDLINGGTANEGSLAFSTRNSAGTITEKMRLTSVGELLVGTTSASGNGVKVLIDGSGSFFQIRRNSTSTIIHTEFANPNGVVGTISTNGTTTAYNTTSDARAKDNIVDAPSAVAKVKAMQVRSFDWKADGSHVDHGFIAQELNEVEPLAVTQGETWSIDPSKLVATLTKALQEALVRIDALEAEVQALKK